MKLWREQSVLGSDLVIKVTWEFSAFLLVEMKTYAWPMVCVWWGEGIIFKKETETQKNNKFCLDIF